MSSIILRRAIPDLSSDKRARSRFEISAACRFWWPSIGGLASVGSGRIANLSIRGVSVATPILPLLGSPLMIEIDLPRLFRAEQLELAVPIAAGEDQHPDSYLLLNAEGVVVRHRGDGEGFAAEITFARFAIQNEG